MGTAKAKTSNPSRGPRAWPLPLLGEEGCLAQPVFLPVAAWQAAVPSCWCAWSAPQGSAMGVHGLWGPAPLPVQWGHWRLAPQAGDGPQPGESCSEPLKQPGPVGLGLLCSSQPIGAVRATGLGLESPCGSSPSAQADPCWELPAGRSGGSAVGHSPRATFQS